MTKPNSPKRKSPEFDDWSAIKARVLAYCERELPRQGVRFTRLHVVHSTRPVYDALVEVWHDKSAHMVGVRLPDQAEVSALRTAQVPAAAAPEAA
jgi:hypothetical protein